MSKLDEIRKSQNKKLKETIDYCLKNSAFYKDKFKGIKPQSIKGVEDIYKLPFTRKKDLVKHSNDFLAVSPEKIVDVSTTSGTIGKPFIIKLTNNDLDRLAVNEYLSFGHAGITNKDTVILAVTLDRCFIAGLAYYTGLCKIGATIVRIGPKSPELLLQLAKETNATCMVGVPSYFSMVYNYAKENNISTNGRYLKKIICIGEPIKNNDFRYNPIGQDLIDKWKCDIFSTYGITEIQTAFCECKAQKGGHALTDLLYVEIVDDHDNVLGENQIGEVVITTFGIEGMPLIRYKTGDLSFLIHEKCQCGFDTPRLGPIIAKKAQKLKIKGVSIYPQAIINILKSIKSIENFVIIATSDSNLTDLVEIRFHLNNNNNNNNNNGDEIKKIKNKLQGNLKVIPKISLASNKEIEEIKTKANKRKKQAFIDKRG